MSSTDNTSQKKYLLLVEIERGYELSGKIYVKVIVPDEKTQKTAIVRGGDNDPIWNERFSFHLDKIPKQIEFEVKEDRSLLPNIVIGNYIVDIHYDHAHDVTSPVKLIDDTLNLDNAKSGRLKVKTLIQYIGTSDMNNTQSNQLLSPILSEATSLSSSDARERSKQQQQQQQQQYMDVPNHQSTINNNISLSKEAAVENKENNSQNIEQPVEIHRKIIHIEKPRIIQVPIIKETHEYIREEPIYIRYDPNVIKEDLGNKQVSQLSPEELDKLRQYMGQSGNEKPNIIYEKEHIRLEPEVVSKPDEIREEQVVYEQPIEIERRYIENIHPKVYEQVTIEKEHVHIKDAPEIQVVEPKTIREDDKYYNMNQTNNNKNNTNTTNVDNTATTNAGNRDNTATTNAGNHDNTATTNADNHVNTKNDVNNNNNNNNTAMITTN